MRLLQKDVAEMIGVTEAAISIWETDTAKPEVCHYPKIALFLGYLPYEGETTSLGGKLLYYQHMKGMTQKELADELGINPSTLYHFGTGKHVPSPKVRMKLESILSIINELGKLPKNCLKFK